MANNLSFGGSVSNSNGYTDYTNNFVYTDGYAFPSGNESLSATHPVVIYGIAAGYAAGNGVQPKINLDGFITSGSVNLDGGGGGKVFRFMIAHTTGRLYFGRNESAGRSVRDSASAGSWNGSLVGSFDWSTVPAMPNYIGATRVGNDVRVDIQGSSSDGGTAIRAYKVQISQNLGQSWGVEQDASSGNTTFWDLAAGSTYQFRVYANNDIGSSGARYWGTGTIPSGGKRFNGSSFVGNDVARRFDGSSFVDLTTARRFDGSSWVDLS